jgi:hypothetical protein
VKRIARKFFAFTLFLLLLSVASHVCTSKAKPQTAYGCTCVSYIPGEWGEFKGGNQQTGLAFQDRAGTLRFVTNLPCDSTPLPALEIHRTAAKPN